MFGVRCIDSGKGKPGCRLRVGGRVRDCCVIVLLFQFTKAIIIVIV